MVRKVIKASNGVKVVLLFLALLGLGACGRARASGVTLELSSQGDQLAFDQTTFQVNSGTALTVIFRNRSKALQHNWVLVKGDDGVADQVSETALTAGLAQEAILIDNAQVLAHTKLLQSGETATISFMAPTEPGAYTYLCTFPGHYLSGMKGTLVVNP